MKNNNDLAKTIGENIKVARKLKGLTQNQVAQIFYMTQQQYSRFENGKYELNYKQLYDICKLLDTCPNELFDFER